MVIEIVKIILYLVQLINVCKYFTKIIEHSLIWCFYYLILKLSDVDIYFSSKRELSQNCL